MALLRAECPVCGADSEVSEEAVARAQAIPCATCGIRFIPSRLATTGTTPGPGTDSTARPGRGIPLPPSVVYRTTGAPGVPVPSCLADPDVPALPSSAPNEADGSTATSTVEGDGPDPSGMVAKPPGPPPPYRPVQRPRRPKPPPAEFALVPPPGEFNLRNLGALGPPPPYRPIIQAGATFARGPAPDLEPWRLASLTQVPEVARDVPPDYGWTEAEWRLHREPAPPVQSQPNPDDPLRVERTGDAAERPFVWPVRVARVRVPPGFAPPYEELKAGRGFRAGLVRRVLWAGGVFGAILAVGALAWLGLSVASGRFRGASAFTGARSGVISVAPSVTTAPK